MATAHQIEKLRKKLQDAYNKRTGAPLTASEYAFNDDELADIINDASAEVTDGLTSAEDLTTHSEAMMILVARADAILQIASDEARRIKWSNNNEAVDPSEVAKNLIAVSKELIARYKAHRDRVQQNIIAGVANRPSGGLMTFNGSVRSNSDRNFNNATVRRNSSPDHRF